MKYLVVAVLFAVAHAQYEAGFIKILEDQRYQDGASFGNYRNQEDGIKYKEETDPNGVRRGSWEYPDADGKIRRVEFEAGRGIGFRIIKSNLVAPTPIANPRTAPAAAAVRPAPIPQAPVVRPAPAPRAPAAQIAQFPFLQARPKQQQVDPQNLFDYPANLKFFRDNAGHRFSFSAV